VISEEIRYKKGLHFVKPVSVFLTFPQAWDVYLICETDRLMGLISVSSVLLKNPEAIKEVTNAGLLLLTWGHDKYVLIKRIRFYSVLLTHIPAMIMKV
jgi:hypothetical protein